MVKKIEVKEVTKDTPKQTIMPFQGAKVYNLQQAINNGKVLVQMNSNHVGEFCVNLPILNKKGLTTGIVPVIFSSGKQIDLLAAFTAKQLVASKDLENALLQGKLRIMS